jgi:hypothetical protein
VVISQQKTSQLNSKRSRRPHQEAALGQKVSFALSSDAQLLDLYAFPYPIQISISLPYEHSLFPELPQRKFHESYLYRGIYVNQDSNKSRDFSCTSNKSAFESDNHCI